MRNKKPVKIDLLFHVTKLHEYLDYPGYTPMQYLEILISQLPKNARSLLYMIPPRVIN